MTTTKQIYVKKRVNCRFGVSLFPNYPYEADLLSGSSQWMVKISNGLWVIVDSKNVKIVA